MLSANDYERIYLTQGKDAADAEFDRQMRPEHIKMVLAFIALVVFFGLVVLTGW